MDRIVGWLRHLLEPSELNELLAAMCETLKQHEQSLYMLTAQGQAVREILSADHQTLYEQKVAAELLQSGSAKEARVRSLDAASGIAGAAAQTIRAISSHCH
jgi:hypothetical protein